MAHKKIISETSGKTVYKSSREGEVLHYFTDTYYCPTTNKIISIPGKGAIAHRISAFFFSRLRCVGIPTHFIRTVNMRESLMYETLPLPFETLVRCCATAEFAQRFGLPEGKIFERPIIDYLHAASGQLVSESHIMTCQWLSPTALDDLQLLIMRTVDILRGLLLGVGLNLLELKLVLGKAYTLDEEEVFFIAGEISPETLCVSDIDTQECLGKQYIMAANPAFHYHKIASRLGLHLGGPTLPRILSFNHPSKKTDHDKS